MTKSLSLAAEGSAIRPRPLRTSIFVASLPGRHGINASRRNCNSLECSHGGPSPALLRSGELKNWPEDIPEGPRCWEILRHIRQTASAPATVPECAACPGEPLAPLLRYPSCKPRAAEDLENRWSGLERYRRERL